MNFPLPVKKRLARLLIFMTGTVVIPYIVSVICYVIVYKGQYDWTFILFRFLLLLPGGSIILHNILRLRFRPWKGCWRIFELLYSLVELVGLLILVAYETYSFGPELWRYWNDDTFMTVFAIPILGVQAVSVSASLLDIWKLGGENLFKPYDISRPDEKDDDHKPIDIFGAQAWKIRYQSETPYMMWARGTVAILCFIIVFITGFWTLFVKPAVDTQGNRTSTKSYWTDELNLFDYPPPNAVVVFPNSPSVASDSQPDVGISMNIISSPPSGTQPIRSVCGGKGVGKFSRNHTVVCRIPQNASVWPRSSGGSDYRREILYSIDFPTTIDPSSLLSFYLVNTTDGVGVESITRTTQGTLIWPGARLLALGSITQVGQLSNRGAAALGWMPNTAVSFLIYNLRSVLQDPSPPPLNGNQSVSLRIVFDFVADFIHGEDESLENTVLEGFSFVGGVWTFVDKLFQIIFGCSLTLVMFGIKPLSVYGLVHFFNPEPRLHVNLQSDPYDEAQVVRMLRQHLLDLRDGEGTQQPSEVMKEENAERGVTQEFMRGEQISLLPSSRRDM